MAGMGKTGTVNVTPEMMEAALKAIESYRSTTDTLYTNVSGEVTNLTESDFTGSVNFYTNNVEKAIGKGLTDILTTLEEICKSIKSGIPDIEGVDEQLATANTSSDQQ